MNTKSLADQGYNLQALKAARRRGFFRKLRKPLLILLVLGLFTKVFFDYLAGLPRERFARDFGYWEKVWLGGKKAAKGAYLGLVAPPSDPKNTKLKIVDLYIEGDALDNLTENLPESGSNYQLADFRIEDKIYQVRARFRGDSINHWAFPHKSWRVRFRKGDTFDGMHLLNLTVPRVETQISNWLGYELGNRIGGGLLVPRAELVHFRLNRNFDGIRMLLEQPNQDFLVNRNLPAGRIYVGDIDSSQIYGKVPRKPLYKDLTPWKIDIAGEESPAPSEMAALIRLLKNEDNPYSFYYQFRDLIDVNSLASYMALLEIVGSVHVDETHNGKFYFNPVEGRFYPIVWDTVAYMWKNQKAIDLGSNSLFRKALSIPEIREQKDAILWNSLTGNLSTKEIQKLINKQAETIRPDVYAFAQKVHANDKGVRYVSNEEWEASIEELYKVVEQRNSQITTELSENDSVYKLAPIGADANLLGVEVRSRSGLKLEQVVLSAAELTEGQEVIVKRHGLADLQTQSVNSAAVINASVRNGKIVLDLNDTLFSKRKFKNKKVGQIVPAQYVYEIQGLGVGRPSVKVENISSQNSITGAAYVPSEDAALNVRREHKLNIVWWKPDDFMQAEEYRLSGQVVLKESLVLDEGRDLVIEPGTQIKAGPGISIVSNGGRVFIKGTQENPVVINALDAEKTWGVLAVNGSPKTEISHLILNGGSFERKGFVRYTGALSLHNSIAAIDNCTIKGSYISAHSSDVKITNCEVSNYYPFAVKSQHSVVQKESITHKRSEPVITSEILTGDVYGTPTRAEREFKYSILDQDREEPLADLAVEIQKALAESVKQPGVWKSPLVVRNHLYTDPSVGDFAFRDFYFDTKDGLAFKHALSYRYRNRFGSYGAHKRHLRKPSDPLYWPRRLEFQAKTGREETGKGFSSVGESRFEFRKESKPFSVDNPPPASPWDVNEFLPYMQSGEFKGVKLLPAREAYEYLSKKESGISELAFKPEIVLITERYRQHLNIKSPWGSGPNPDQSYIISLDRSHAYVGSDYLGYLNARKQGDKNASKPKRVAYLTEIEVEFERNVSDVLDRKINEAKASGNEEDLNELVAAREAFMEDQQTIMKVVKDYFAEKGVKVQPANKSKYVQAYELVNLSTKVR